MQESWREGGVGGGEGGREVGGRWEEEGVGDGEGRWGGREGYSHESWRIRMNLGGFA